MIINHISRFLSNNKEENNKFIFLGPENYMDEPYYIHDNMFALNVNRRIDNVNTQIDFVRESIKIMEYIDKI